MPHLETDALLGVSNPTKAQIGPVACLFHAYHAVRNRGTVASSYFESILGAWGRRLGIPVSRFESFDEEADRGVTWDMFNEFQPEDAVSLLLHTPPDIHD
eukprot:10864882-Karenia_brevis.AAC.1